MSNINREKLIKNSIRCRAFKNDNNLFVNIITPTRIKTFSCETHDLIESLNIPAFKYMPLITSISTSLDNKIIFSASEDNYFIKDEITNRFFIGTLNNGKVIKYLMKKIDFEYCIPTIKEYEKLILNNIEDF